MNMMYDVAIIGAGPAGLMAAVAATLHQRSCILLERNGMVGKKLLITGGGKCNLTNNEPLKDLIAATINHGKSLNTAFYTFSNAHLMEWIQHLGIPLKTNPDGKVYPVSEKSRDIRDAILAYLNQHNVPLAYDQHILTLQKGEEYFEIVSAKEDRFVAKNVIVATGGLSFPRTGSTGDGYQFARSFGHTIIPPIASLCALETKETIASELQGIPIREALIRAFVDHKKICSYTGDLMFTHFGVSGPPILNISAHINRAVTDQKQVLLRVDLIPSLSLAALEHRIIQFSKESGGKRVKSILGTILPAGMVPILLSHLGVSQEQNIAQLKSEERSRILSHIKDFPLTVSSLRPIQEATVTSGGVDLREIHLKTMESKIVGGLFFAGELIDADALCGGYNLQIAFSTGYLAGLSIP